MADNRPISDSTEGDLDGAKKETAFTKLVRTTNDLLKCFCCHKEETSDGKFYFDSGR